MRGVERGFAWFSGGAGVGAAREYEDRTRLRVAVRSCGDASGASRCETHKGETALKKHTQSRVVTGTRALALAGALGALTPMAIAQPIPPGWQLTWQDEFNGTSLDGSKWRAEEAALVKNNEQQYYAANYVTVSNGFMRIKSDRVPRGGRPYTSGLIESRNRFSQTFGRFEIRARLPKTQGIWPAIWMLPQGGGWPPEIDIMELLGHEPNTVYMTNHWGTWPNVQNQSTPFTGPDFSEEYHVFACEWFTDRIDFYVDGIRRASHRSNVPQSAFYLIINTAVGGIWPGYPDATTVFPQYLDVDWVRVYQPVMGNMSFEEQGPGGGTPLYGWTRTGNTNNVQTNARSGVRTAKLAGNYNGGANISTISRDEPVTPGKLYRFSAWFYNSNLEPIAGTNYSSINIEWRTAGGSLIRVDTTRAVDAASPENVHERFKVESVAPANAATARLAIRFHQFANANGSVFVDDALFWTPVSCPADLNFDGMVDDLDFVEFAAAYENFVCSVPSFSCPGDLNDDGMVDDNDFVTFANGYEQFVCP